MTHPTLDHEERLRRALRAAADSVEPAADGLGRIRARLTPPRPVIAAWMVSWTEPAMLRLRLAVPWLRLRLDLAHGRIGPVAGRAHPALGRIIAAFTGIMPSRGEPRTRTTWLRAAGAMAAFVVIIGSGALAISQLEQTATTFGSTAAVGQSGGHPNSGSGGGQAEGTGTARQMKNSWLKNTTWPLAPLTPQLSMGLLAPEPHQVNPAPSSTCPPSPKPSLTPSPTPTPTPTSVSPTPSPTPTPTPTSVSPTPSPSGSVSPSPGASDVPTPSGAPAASGGSVNTVAYVVGPLSGSTVSPSPATNKSACAPTGQ